MPASKIQDHTEVKRWFDEGATYPQMVDRYREKYNIETTIQMWSNYGRRRGLKRRVAWDPQLLPWKVRDEHRNRGHYVMLTREARRRAGLPVPEDGLRRLESWKAKLQKSGRVVHYDPDVEPYFFAVPARPGIDTDLIRVPDKVERALPSRE
ncbi:hypothetical protein [Puerhibacterium puerhi]|uniref:hypothetical protein n=1 Tax=Puerhibacterium puerhi TaxID=2692623 RepID=UPI0013591801|nr:hypothetical protein [Puerhibacterium puerhi]